MSPSPFLHEPPGTAHPKVVALHRYWCGLAPGEGLLPGRRHVDPADIRHLLPNVWLLDVVGAAPPRFRFRLIGSALRELGIPARPGDFLDDLVPDASLLDPRSAVATRRPVWFRGKPRLRHTSHIHELERLLLPLAADGHAVDMILCLTVFYTSQGTTI